jgi:hypothetical protein
MPAALARAASNASLTPESTAAPARAPDVSGLTPGELERTRRELLASLALSRPGSPMRGPILAHLGAIDTELARRTASQ